MCCRCAGMMNRLLNPGEESKQSSHGAGLAVLLSVRTSETDKGNFTASRQTRPSSSSPSSSSYSFSPLVVSSSFGLRRPLLPSRRQSEGPPALLASDNHCRCLQSVLTVHQSSEDSLTSLRPHNLSRLNLPGLFFWWVSSALCDPCWCDLKRMCVYIKEAFQPKSYFFISPTRLKPDGAFVV